jgi:hypothetical protein
VVDTPDQVFVHIVEDLIDFSLTEIEHPLNMIPETPAGNYSEPTILNLTRKGLTQIAQLWSRTTWRITMIIMKKGETPPQNNQPWLARDALEIPGRVHNLPQHLEKLLPKFDPETFGLLEDHIKKFILDIRLMNVQHEDIVCMIFPYTFENSASTWYFNLHVGSITSWTKFQKYFLDKFVEETTT